MTIYSKLLLHLYPPITILPCTLLSPLVHNGVKNTKKGPPLVRLSIWIEQMNTCSEGSGATMSSTFYPVLFITPSSTGVFALIIQLESTSEAGESKWLHIDVIDDHIQIWDVRPCKQISAGDFAIGHRRLPQSPVRHPMPFFGIVRCLGGCASIFSGSNCPPTSEIIAGIEIEKTGILSSEGLPTTT